LTNIADAKAAVEYGADLLGFIGVKASPRYLNDETFEEITSRCPPFVHRVLVVNEIPDAEDYVSSWVQYYTDSQSDGQCRQQDRVRCFRIKDASSLEEIRNYKGRAAAYLLDTYHKDKLGGSGELFNWELAVEIKKMTDKPIILAGGLTPENVQDALEAVRPYAVDVSSGVESSPGVKDHAKVRAFIRAVREWDLKHG
jgi:phosphoribosylanthranilate isomerase